MSTSPSIAEIWRSLRRPPPAVTVNFGFLGALGWLQAFVILLGRFAAAPPVALRRERAVRISGEP
jgi:hypothetical protein